MKKVFFLFLLTFAFFLIAKSQSFCSYIKVTSPVVKKPAQGTVLSATCTQLTVQWKGAANQTYIVNATYKNPDTQKNTTASATSTSCDNSNNCTAIIPVKEGTNVNWSVQAIQDVNGRTFYSYVFRDVKEYSIPSCTQTITKASVQNKPDETALAKNKLIVYPNPATDNIIVQWSSNYKGSAVIAIYDAIGKVVKTVPVTKGSIAYTNNINISTLVHGLYYVGVQAPHSPMLTAKFLKQ